jgi:origin recognition complex subunit 5
MDTLSSEHPGYEALITDLAFLLECAPPPFIYVHDAASPRLAGRAIGGLLNSFSTSISGAGASLTYTELDAVVCFNARLFYDTAINALAGWAPKWEDGCANWAPPGREGHRWNDSLDSFFHGLRAVRDWKIALNNGGNGRDTQLVLLIERAERLRDSLPELVVPLSRLGELVSARCHVRHAFFLLKALNFILSLKLTQP